MEIQGPVMVKGLGQDTGRDSLDPKGQQDPPTQRRRFGSMLDRLKIRRQIGET